ncbi:uncharacterized protein LOC143030096 [Oratosquilla oratoria]|uniref:uncharacterized protein LOC143030096 n=1 Tax=Oratosquilla oratoria TaxID=337810 RepID=UPI003F75892C
MATESPRKHDRTKTSTIEEDPREPEEIDNRWKEYFSSLLNIEEDGERTDEEQSNGDWVDEEEGINRLEVKKALANIKNNKAYCEVSNDWSTALICPVFKKEDHAECSNYSRTQGKYMNECLRLVCAIEHILAEAQHGFRPNRETSDLIFALKMILEKSWEFDQDKYVTLLDLEKTFGRVPRDKLWSVLQIVEYQISP